MKWLIRVLVFALALLLGVVAARIALTSFMAVAENEVYNFDRPTAETGVRVDYIGMSKNDDGSQWLQFEIQNGLFQPLSYRAHSSGGLFPNIKVRGEKIDGLGRCGTGLMPYFLLPTSSVVVSVAAYEFTKRPEKNDTIAVGFYLNKTLSGEPQIYWSEPMVLHEDFRLAIRER